MKIAKIQTDEGILWICGSFRIQLFTSWLIVSTIYKNVNITRVSFKISDGILIRVINIYEICVCLCEFMYNSRQERRFESGSCWIKAGNPTQLSFILKLNIFSGCSSFLYFEIFHSGIKFLWLKDNANFLTCMTSQTMSNQVHFFEWNSEISVSEVQEICDPTTNYVDISHYSCVIKGDEQTV